MRAVSLSAVPGANRKRVSEKLQKHGQVCINTIAGFGSGKHGFSSCICCSGTTKVRAQVAPLFLLLSSLANLPLGENTTGRYVFVSAQSLHAVQIHISIPQWREHGLAQAAFSWLAWHHAGFDDVLRKLLLGQKEHGAGLLLPERLLT